MRISTAQMAQLFAQAMQGAKEHGGSLELKVGTVVQATLLEVLNKTDALIQVGAQKLQAKLDVPLQAGDRLSLLVTGGQRNGAMELKVIGQSNTADSKPPLDISRLLQAVGLPDEEGNQALVREWVARQLPLQGDVLRAAGDVLKQLPAPTPSAVSTLGKMAELGIPIQLGTFEAMDALENGPKFHELLGNVLAQLQEVLPESKTGGTAQGANADLQQPPLQTGEGEQVPLFVQTEGETGIATSTTGQTTNTLHTPETAGSAGLVVTANGANDPEKSSVPNSQSLSSSASTSASSAHEDALANRTATDSNLFPGIKISRQSVRSSDANARDNATGNAVAQGGQTSPTVKTGAGLSTATRAHLTELSQTVRRLLDDTGNTAQELEAKSKQLGLGFEEKLGQAVRRLPPDSSTAQVQEALANIIQPAGQDADTTTLKQALFHVQQSGQELESSGLQQLSQDVTTLLQQVTGQQLMQSPGQQRSDLFYQFTAVPMNLEGRPQTLELHVMSRKSPGQKNLDPSNCYILFHLDLPHLGELDIHLHIVDKVVGLRFFTTTPEQVSLQPDDAKELRSALQAVGFHLGAVKVEEKTEPVPGERLPLLPPILTQGTLDLKA